MVKTRLGNSTDIDGILSLQEDNLFSNLTTKESEKGFVTTPFTKAQIEEIIKQNGIFVAENNENKIIAYAFAESWKYFEQWDIFNFMTARFPKLLFNNKNISTENSFQYGPVCINKEYRSKGILNLIFEEMRIEFVKKYTISITFINRVNVISEKAHTKKLGWEIIDEFKFNNNTYIGLAFDMSKSVINSNK